ncbi:MAG: AzlD domain-containing protein [Treponema sp.]|jgi:branched-subunit amino acid transport protein AzlD|nr:AzlD domain-containing protein [Treponema sp.]
MKVSVTEAAIMICAMGAVIFFSRAFPFIFFSNTGNSRSKGARIFLDFIERIVPPAAMTVLAFNALGPSIRDLTKNLLSLFSSSPVSGEFGNSSAVIIAAILTALIHIWKRNPLISIFAGTGIFMILQRMLAL